MQQFSAQPKEVILSLVKNRDLIYLLAKREIQGRYRGSMMGVFWSFLTPLLMLAVYTFIFSVVFKARWSVGSDSKTEFALVLFAGLIVFNLFSECVNRAPSLILSNVNYVKKVVFPLEVLPWVSMGAALFHLMISLAVWLIFHIVFFGIPHASILLFPVILVSLVLFTMGISWALASLGVYLRDIGQLTGIFTTIMMFLSPIFYPLSSLPPQYRNLFILNPLTPTIEQTRSVLIFGGGLDWVVTLISFVIALLVSWLGFFWFQKTRKGFADVI
jgi:lipopolysaccharide transport system permease protein